MVGSPELRCPDTGSRGQRKFDRGLTSPGSIEVVQLPTGQAGVVKMFAEEMIRCDAVLSMSPTRRRLRSHTLGFDF